MDTARAFEIVLELARGNILDDQQPDDDLYDVWREQIEACDMIEDLAVNEYGDD